MPHFLTPWFDDMKTLLTTGNSQSLSTWTSVGDMNSAIAPSCTSNASMIGLLKAILQALPSANANDYLYAIHYPAANTKATATLAAPGAGKHIVIDNVSASLQAGALAVALGTVQLKAGATVRYQQSLIAAISGIATVEMPMQIMFPEDTAATLEFTAASGANTTQGVCVTGRIVTKA